MNELGWKCLLTPFAWQAARQEKSPVPKRLKRALLTSFDAVDAGLLVEHLLPHWLRISRDLAEDDVQRNPFVVELSESLKSVESFVVVTSAMFPDRSCPYPWLWRFVHWFMVGARRAAVQHAKLWLLEWDEPRVLEVCVSSANLTMSAFKAQIQAAWRCSVPLEDANALHRDSWGILPDFLEELANACGSRGQAEVSAFSRIFDHAKCPDGVRFVASVPGTHSPETLKRRAWGMKGIAGAMPPSPGIPRVIVTAPIVGAWHPLHLQKWLRTCGCPNSGLTLKWIRDDAIQYKEHWTLPFKTFEILRGLGASIRGIAQHRDFPAPTVHEQHRSGDQRWLHAKLYGFSRGIGHNTLVTSANFTPSAWGRPSEDGLRIENFELGVLLEGRRYPMEVEPLDGERVWRKELTPNDPSGEIVWAEAEWDGTTISIDYRVWSVENQVDAVVVVAVANGIEVESGRRNLPPDSGMCRRLQIPWDNPRKIPVEARLETASGRTAVPIRDSRDFRVRVSAPLPQPGLDEKTEENLREDLLLERYNAAVTAGEGDEGENDPLPGDDRPTTERLTDDYTLPASKQAREWFSVIDEWENRIARFQQDDALMRVLLLEDGRRLEDYFRRQSRRHFDSGYRVAASLVAEEMRFRLQNINPDSKGPRR